MRMTERDLPGRSQLGAHGAGPGLCRAAESRRGREGLELGTVAGMGGVSLAGGEWGDLETSLFYLHEAGETRTLWGPHPCAPRTPSCSLQHPCLVLLQPGRSPSQQNPLASVQWPHEASPPVTEYGLHPPNPQQHPRRAPRNSTAPNALTRSTTTTHPAPPPPTALALPSVPHCGPGPLLSPLLSPVNPRPILMFSVFGP